MKHKFFDMKYVPMDETEAANKMLDAGYEPFAVAPLVLKKPLDIQPSMHICTFFKRGVEVEIPDDAFGEFKFEKKLETKPTLVK